MVVTVVSEPSGSNIDLGCYTEEQLREKQEQDQNLAFLMQWLKTGEEPKEGTLFLDSPEAKFYRVSREAFVLGSGGTLVREKTDKYPSKLVVPETCR